MEYNEKKNKNKSSDDRHRSSLHRYSSFQLPPGFVMNDSPHYHHGQSYHYSIYQYRFSFHLVCCHPLLKPIEMYDLGLFRLDLKNVHVMSFVD